MSDSTKKLFLLDAYALIYRAHFAFTKTPRINSRGINTSVPFGFTNTLLEVIQKQKPTHIAVAFDTAAPTFRDEIFEEYKATRQETPEDIRYGIPKVKEIIRGFNIPILEMDGYEADDIIGTLAKRAEKNGFEVYMMTPDKDFGQLVTDNIFLYKPAYMGNAVDVLGTAEVCEKWDIENVSQVIDMLGLQGDSSDNIPGVPGVGPKTAATLLKKYGSIENIIAHASELKGKQKELFETYAEQAKLSKKLATIITDVPVKYKDEDLLYTGPNEEILKPIFQDLEFKSIQSRAFGGASVKEEPKSKSAQLSMFGGGNDVVNEEVEKTSLATSAKSYKEVSVDALAKLLKEAKEFSIEMFSNNEGELDILSCSVKSGEALVVKVNGDGEKIITGLRTVFEDDSKSKIGHNVKAMLLLCKNYGVELKGELFDSLIAHYLIEPEAAHDLNTITSFYLNYQLLGDTDGTVEDRICERVDVAHELKKKLEKELKERGHTKLMNEVEMPLMKVLASMEFEGVKVDKETLAIMSDELRKESERVQEHIYELAGAEFNIASPKQLGEILFEKLKLVDKPKKTKTGQYATGEDVLVKLSGEHEIAQEILNFREYEKLRSTYVDALPKLISNRDGRIHTDYRQAVAATGRLSSNNPNLQNIPIRTEKGRQIRKAFVPRDKNFKFMSADYSQIELRIAASFANDEIMIEAFKNKRDIHTTTAAKVFKVPVEQVTPDMRRKAKEVNFGILYGSTAFGLSQNLNISRSEAAEIINAYFEEFPTIKRYMDNAILKAREEEYVETLLGRRRYLRDINSRNITTRGFAERNAINAPIQGSAADIIKIAMVNIHAWLQKEKLKTKMIMQVHDELVFDVHKDEVDIVKDNVMRLMQGAANLEVPMEVEVGVADNWLEAH